MAQQTAVEWLLNNMADISHYIPIGVTIELHAKFQAAERMHKEQIIEFAEQYNMYLLKCKKGVRGSIVEMDAEQYYNETFGKS